MVAGVRAYPSQGQNGRQQCHIKTIQEGPFTQAGVVLLPEACRAEERGTLLKPWREQEPSGRVKPGWYSGSLSLPCRQGAGP